MRRSSLRIAILLAFLVLHVAPRALFAQKLYLFSEGDYNAANVQTAVRAGANLVRETIQSLTPPSRLVVYNESSSWRGPNIEYSNDLPTDVIKAIDACPAGSNDAIFFYWVGHGAFDQGGHFLWTKGGVGDDAIRRDKILAALKKKNVRLVVFVTESCHVFQKFPVRNAPGSGLFSDVCPVMRSLFFECKGVVNANSSSPNQSAAAHEIFGGPFTFFFMKTLSDNANRKMTWKQVFDKVDSENRAAGLSQKVYRWSLPSGNGSAGGGGSENRGGDWSAPKFYPENGDRIIEINVLNEASETVTSDAQFRRIVRDANNRTITLTCVDHRTGKRYYLMTDLLPKGSKIRLGIYTKDTGGEGVLVTGHMNNTPGAKCRYLQNGDVAPIYNRR